MSWAVGMPERRVVAFLEFGKVVRRAAKGERWVGRCVCGNQFRSWDTYILTVAFSTEDTINRNSSIEPKEASQQKVEKRCK